VLVADCRVHAFALARFYSLDREAQGRGSHWYVIAPRVRKNGDRSRLSPSFLPQGSLSARFSDQSEAITAQRLVGC
jgi:hypothetical protein